jgi:MazG family protein
MIAPMPHAPLKELEALVAKLRQECPWDREQTPETIKTFLLEECYETLEALDSSSPEKLREELGDLLFQLYFLARLAQERGWFDIEDVARAVSRKMVDRHPHVFGGAEAANAQEVKRNWETRKRQEGGTESDPLGTVPASLPAIAAAHRMTSRAADLGFDWDRDADVASKIEEELAEWRAAAERGDTAAAISFFRSSTSHGGARSIPSPRFAGPTRGSANALPESRGGPRPRGGTSRRSRSRSSTVIGRKRNGMRRFKIQNSKVKMEGTIPPIWILDS